jgi:hemoglobin
MQRFRNDNEEIGLEKIKAVVDEFYNRIQEHPTLAEPFQIVEDWPEHKDKLAHFWWLSLGGEPYANYQYNVGPLHMVLPINDSHVEDWLELFFEVMSKHIPEEQVDAWHGRAQNMGRSIKMMVAYHQQASQQWQQNKQ